MQIDALFHLPFSDLWSDQYSMSRYEIKPNITPKWLGFHRNSTTIDPIANRTIGDERGHTTAYFVYRLCHDTMRTPILNCSKKCWLLMSGFRVETRCISSVPGWNQTQDQIGNSDPLLTLHVNYCLPDTSFALMQLTCPIPLSSVR